MTKFFTKILLILISTSAYCSTIEPSSQISAFKKHLVTDLHFKKNEIDHAMANAHYNQKIIDLMNSPYEKKSYTEYRKLFVSPTKIANGKKFIKENRPYLEKISKIYGVPIEIITAIIGVESNYKPVKTKHHALDSLYTLAFFYPKRAKFFKYELEQYLLLCRELGISPESVTGSYAGALGMPQFMPSNYRHLAKSTSGHVPNLFTNKNDTMASIANYMHHFGWVWGQTPAIKVNTSKLKNKLAVNDILTIAELNNMGIKTAPSLNKKLKARVLDTNEPLTDNVWLGLTDIKVIESYNHSDLYALAVFELAENIKG